VIPCAHTDWENEWSREVHMRIDERQLDLIDAAGGIQSAMVYLDEWDGPDGGIPEDNNRVTIQWAGNEVSAIASDYFSALSSIRDELGCAD